MFIPWLASFNLIYNLIKSNFSLYPLDRCDYIVNASESKQLHSTRFLHQYTYFLSREPSDFPHTVSALFTNTCSAIFSNLCLHLHFDHTPFLPCKTLTSSFYIPSSFWNRTTNRTTQHISTTHMWEFQSSSLFTSTCFFSILFPLQLYIPSTTTKFQLFLLALSVRFQVP